MRLRATFLLPGSCSSWTIRRLRQATSTSCAPSTGIFSKTSTSGRGRNRHRFIDRLAHHYDQFNYLHPFREGNGRTQRVFWNRVPRDAGWQLDWRGVHGATNDHACRTASDRRDFGPLREMFDQVVTKAAADARDDAWRTAERARLSSPTSPTQAVRHRPDGPSSAP